MLKNNSIGIIYTGRYLPKKRVPNSFFETYLNTSEDWIKDHTGIIERRFADVDEPPSILGIKAISNMKGKIKGSMPKISTILNSTNLGDVIAPATAAIIQEGIKTNEAIPIDIHSGCMGFLHGLFIANGICQTTEEAILVVASETPTRWNDMFNRDTCVFFGDGAGVVLIKRVKNGYGFLSFWFENKGALIKLTGIPAGGSSKPIDWSILGQRQNYGFMLGKQLFKIALEKIPYAVKMALKKADIGISEVDLFIPHQANKVMLVEIAKILKVPSCKFMINVDKYGNTSSASIPIAIDEAVEQGRVWSGAIVVLMGIGAGLGYGAVVMKWI